MKSLRLNFTVFECFNFATFELLCRLIILFPILSCSFDFYLISNFPNKSIRLNLTVFECFNFATSELLCRLIILFPILSCECGKSRQVKIGSK